MKFFKEIILKRDFLHCFTSARVEAFSALILAMIAIYGMFFTSIPEKIAEQYNAEIATLKKSLEDLNKTKTDTEESLAQAQLELSEQRKRAEKYRNDVQLEVLAALRSGILSDLATMKNYALMASTIAEYHSWRKAQPEALKRGLFSNTYNLEHREWLDKIPSAWANIYYEPVRVKYNKDCYETKKDIQLETSDCIVDNRPVLERLQEDILESKVIARFGRDLVLNNIEKPYLGALLEVDRSVIIRDIKEFILKYEDQFSSPVYIDIQSINNEEELTLVGKKTLSTIDQLNSLIERLFVELAGSKAFKEK